MLRAASHRISYHTTTPLHYAITTALLYYYITTLYFLPQDATAERTELEAVRDALSGFLELGIASYCIV